MSRWFRLYDEVLDDPKVQKLSPEMFKFWINILCLASKHGGILPDTESISFALRVPFHETQECLDFLFQSKLLDSTKKGKSPHGWAKRQYKSDTSTDRVKRFRQRSRNVTETVTVTPPETDTEQRQKQIQIQSQNPALFFPSDGSIEFSVWSGRVRAHGKNLDPDWVANQFRGFCSARKIDLKAPNIVQVFDGFLRAQKVA